MADFADKKAQVDRTQQVNDLVTEAKDLYAKLFTYTPGEEDLITVAGGNGSIDAGTLESNVEGNQIAFYHFRGQGVATSDDYKFLIDGDDETYMQGSGSIDIDLSQTPQRYVTFEYSTRCASMEKGNANQHKWGVQERPNFIQIYAAKDTVDGGDWAMVGSTSLGALKQSELTEPFDPVFYTLDLGDTYGFIRYEVISNANGGSYFTLSEFQVHPASVDETTSGKLPQTFERFEADNPTYNYYNATNKRVQFKEGIYVGYRGFEKNKKTPLFPFGFGLSYTTFELSDLQATSSEATVTVRNTGQRAGSEVVQIYVSPTDNNATIDRPAKELRGFAKVALQHGESKTVTIPLDNHAYSYFDITTHAFRQLPGTYRILAGTSSADLPLQAEVVVE